ncbi:hypothetical protein Athai_59540 [Actinocatenispora thailandica]|uniref:VOC domain-containing protein n=1 Tax=Actinocatenispora thailandica TaxID=227318 RepID=A0A7R7I0D2_9ACTN|nr:VOC family protein [Actinocatenispora thailandica]BCJ38451.1 hypothetical protein Athai_59540 [Actinocatenispora thailandica]
MAVGRLRAVAIDCAEPEELAEFWAALTGGKVAFRSPQFCAVDADGSWLSTVRVADYAPPTWPDGPAPKQLHFEVSVTDLDAAEAAALELGARKANAQPAPDRWRVFLDPAGHPFCLTTQIPD